METLLIVVTLFAVFEYAAVRWGYDSRDAYRPRRY